MPNFIANRFYNAIATMAAKVLDNTDQDGLGIYIVSDGNTRWSPYVWRKNSSETADGDLVVNGTAGQWVKFAPIHIGNDAPSGKFYTYPAIYIQTNTNVGEPLTYYYTAPGGSPQWKIKEMPPAHEDIHDPDVTPDVVGQIWVNTVTREIFQAGGTDNAANWVSVGVAGTQ